MVAATACCICEFGLALGKEHADTMNMHRISK